MLQVELRNYVDTNWNKYNNGRMLINRPIINNNQQYFSLDGNTMANHVVFLSLSPCLFFSLKIFNCRTIIRRLLVVIMIKNIHKFTGASQLHHITASFTSFKCFNCHVLVTNLMWDNSWLLFDCFKQISGKNIHLYTCMKKILKKNVPSRWSSIFYPQWCKR